MQKKKEESSPLKRRVTLGELSRRLGLSKRAVSQALQDGSGTVRVSSATKERVLALADELGYRKNFAARAMFNTRSGIYGILAWIGEMHQAQLRMTTAIKEFDRYGYAPLVVQARIKNGTPDLRHAHLLIDANVNGVLLLAGSPGSQAYADEISAYGIPVVAISSAKHTGIPTYSPNRRQGFCLLAEHLIGRGYRRLATLISSSGHDPKIYEPSRQSQESLAGISDAIAKANASGISVVNEEVDMDHIVDSSRFSDLPDIHSLHAEGYLAMWHLIERGELPDAILCQADGFANGALRACAEAGLRVPEDIAITGYGNDPSSTASTTPLTTVEEPTAQLCKLALRHLLSISDGSTEPQPQSITLPGRLIIRKSSSMEWGNLPKDLYALHRLNQPDADLLKEPLSSTLTR